MILILGYNSSETEFLNENLDALNVDYSYSLLESKIIAAEKFILPHPISFNSTYRKLNMMNLFSLLKMIEKPILGINNGFRLMCSQLLNSSKCGLGFFSLELNSDSDLNNVQDLTTGKLIVDANSKLIRSKFEGEEIKFNQNSFSKECDYAKVSIKSNNSNYSLTYENENYFGVEMNFELNPKLSREILANFVKV